MTGRLTFVCFVVLFTLAIIPLLSVPLPPLFDYPNHLGRMAVLAAKGQDPILNRYYTVRWGILPNLAMDAVVPWLSGFVPLIDAGRVFLVATLFLLAVGPMLLYRVWWGAWSPWACTGFLFFYSRVFLWGFVNYLAGVGLALCVLAGWILLERRAWSLRGLAGGVAATIVFFCHLEAFGVLALLLLGAEMPKLVEAFRRRDVATLGARAAALTLALLPATLLFVMAWQPHAEATLTLPRLDRKPDLLFSVFDNYSRPFDVVCFLAFLGAGITACVRGGLRVATPAIWPLSLIGTLYLVLPSTLFTGEGADHRLPLVLFLILAAATKPTGLTRPHLVAVAAALLALFVVRMAVIDSVWRAAARTYRADIAILSLLPSGARVAVAAPASAVRVSAAPEYHLPVLAIFLRQAFVPTLFAFPTQQPVAVTSAWRDVAAASDPDRVWRSFDEASTQDMSFRRFVAAHFDAVVFIGPSAPRILGSPCMVLLGKATTFSLYQFAATGTHCSNGRTDR